MPFPSITITIIFNDLTFQVRTIMFKLNGCKPVPVTVFCSTVFLIGTPANVFVSYCYHIKHPTWKRSPVQIKLFKLLAVSDITPLVTAAILAPLNGIVFSKNSCSYFFLTICIFGCYSQGVVSTVATSRSLRIIYPLAPERPRIQYGSLIGYMILMSLGILLTKILPGDKLILILCQTVSIALLMLTLLTSFATINCLVRSSGPLTASKESGNDVLKSSNSNNGGNGVSTRSRWTNRISNGGSVKKQSQCVAGIDNRRRSLNSVITLLIMNLPYTLSFVNLMFFIAFKKGDFGKDLAEMMHMLILPVLTSAYNLIVLLVRKRDFSNRLKSLLVTVSLKSSQF